MPPFSLLFVFYSESVWAFRTQLSPNDAVTYTKKMGYQGDRTHQTQWFPSFLVNLHSETLVFSHMQGCWDTHTKPFKFQDLHFPFADLLRWADRMIFKAFKISDPHNDSQWWTWSDLTATNKRLPKSIKTCWNKAEGQSNILCYLSSSPMAGHGELHKTLLLTLVGSNWEDPQGNDRKDINI